MAEVFILDSEQPATCPKCGARTEFEETFEGMQDNQQRHTCPKCGFTFIGEFEFNNTTGVRIMASNATIGVPVLREALLALNQIPRKRFNSTTPGIRDSYDVASLIEKTLRQAGYTVPGEEPTPGDRSTTAAPEPVNTPKPKPAESFIVDGEEFSEAGAYRLAAARLIVKCTDTACEHDFHCAEGVTFDSLRMFLTGAGFQI